MLGGVGVGGVAAKEKRHKTHGFKVLSGPYTWGDRSPGNADEEIWNRNSGREARILIPNFRCHILRLIAAKGVYTRTLGTRDSRGHILRFIVAAFLD